MAWPPAPARGDSTTLAQGVSWLSPDRPVIGCACWGGAPGDTLCGCHRATVESRAVKHAAHVIARLLADRADQLRT
jgi:hypothetical protein